MSNVSGGFGFEQQGEGKTNTWLTPPRLVQMLGEFDLDPCAMPTDWCFTCGTDWPKNEECQAQHSPSPTKRPWVLAKQNFTIQEDGLSQPWEGRVFCNPPYGPHVKKWAARMAAHRNGIFLIFSRTETDAWAEIWKQADAVLFPFGRMCFYLPDGKRAKSGTAPSALLAYGQNNVETLRKSGVSGALVMKAEWLGGVKVSSL